MRSLWSQVKKLKGIPSIYVRRGWNEDAQRVLPESFLPKTILSENPDLKGYCLLYTSPSPRDRQKSRMPSSA